MRAILVEDLDALIAAVRHVDPAVAVGIDAMDAAELSRAIAPRAPLLDQLAVFVQFDDARVAKAVCDQNRSVWQKRQILRLAFTSKLWGRPFVAPPGLPPERARLLREAFQETARDPAFLAEAKKLGFDIGLLSGEEMAGLIAGLYASPADIIEATRAALRGDRK